MMGNLDPDFGLLDILNQGDEQSFKFVIAYLRYHDFPYLNDRAHYELTTDFGVIRPLREVWIKLFNIDSKAFIDFYEGVYRFRKIPHFENLFLTIFISFMTGFAANLVYDKYKVWIQKSENAIILEKFKHSVESLIQYIFPVLAIREAYYSGKMSINHFVQTIGWLKSKIFANSLEHNKEIETNFDSLWSEFAERHKLPPLNELLSEINDFTTIGQKIMENNVSIQKEKLSESQNDYIFKGQSFSGGVAFGIVKVIKSIKDVYIINEGDIGYFSLFSVDLIEGIKKCSGIIGRYGEHGISGRTGHLAITCRALGIPYIVYDGNGIHQGQIAYLDGDEGTITIIQNMKDIKTLLS